MGKIYSIESFLWGKLNFWIIKKYSWEKLASLQRIVLIYLFRIVCHGGSAGWNFDQFWLEFSVRGKLKEPCSILGIFKIVEQWDNFKKCR